MFPVRGGLPHDMLAVTSWSEDGASFRVYAMATGNDPFAQDVRAGVLDDAMRLAYERYSGAKGFTMEQFYQTMSDVAAKPISPTPNTE